MNLSVCILNCKKAESQKITKVFKDYPGFSFLGISQNYDDALDLIFRVTPDIIFIDLTERKNFTHSPIQLIRELYQYLDYTPMLIALSGSKDNAYEAIKIGCSDYLLTPLTELQLRKSLFMIRRKTKTTSPNRICLKSYSDYQFLELSEILFLKADGNTTDIMLIEGKKIPAFKPIKKFDSILPKNFLRVHKSYIINTDFLLRINFAKSRVTLFEENIIPFSRSHRDHLEKLKETFFNLEAV